MANQSVLEAIRQYNEAEAPFAVQDVAEEQKARDRFFNVPAELTRNQAVVLCSVWPEPLHSQPFHHGGVGRKIYSMAAGSPENPAYLLVENTWDWTIIQEGEGKRGDTQRPIMGWQIAVDLVNYWTGDHPGNKRGKKGIGVIKGNFNKDKGEFEATPEEISFLVKAQHDFLTYLVERADQFWETGQREKVTGSREYKKALQMLGLDINQHPWYRSKVQLYNECPRCAEKIMVNASFCKHCHSDLVEYFNSRGVTPDKAMWPKVVEEIEISGRKKSK